MSLLDIYIEKSRDKKQMEHACENAYLFDFTTNFRDLLYFEEGFKTFKKICGMNADELKAYVEESPSKARSFSENMMCTKLFMTKGGSRTTSAKGDVYEKFLLEKMTADDRWFMNYLFVVDSYFSLKSNYIFAQTDAVFAKLLEAGYTLSQIYNALIYLFNIRENSIEEYLRTEYIVMITFMDDPAFLSLYRESSEFEKNEMHEYIVDNFTKQNYNCLVSARFSPTALIDAETVLDDAKILFFSHYIDNSHPISLEDMLEIFSQVYTRFYKLNSKKVLNFVMMYEDIFKMTYLNLFSDMQDFYLNLRLDDKVLADNYEDEGSIEELIKEPIDYTTTDSINALVKINSVLSANARIETDYHCELDDENHCKYFTSKASGKPYLEIHQLIPRDYSNEFSASIEVPSNYIALCPHCHRLIHNATDSERFRLLSQIYRKRKFRLEADGIVPGAKLLFAIYGIEQEKLKPGENDFEKPLLEQAQPKLPAGRAAAKKPPAAKKTAAKKSAAKKKSQE